MNRTTLALAAVLGSALTLHSQSFSVSFTKEASAQPLDGRVLLVLSTDPSDEPRNQMLFCMNVDGLMPGKAAIVDAKAQGFPVASLKDVPPGEYYVQAVLNK